MAQPEPILQAPAFINAIAAAYVQALEPFRPLAGNLFSIIGLEPMEETITVMLNYGLAVAHAATLPQPPPQIGSELVVVNPNNLPGNWWDPLTTAELNLDRTFRPFFCTKILEARTGFDFIWQLKVEDKNHANNFHNYTFYFQAKVVRGGVVDFMKQVGTAPNGCPNSHEGRVAASQHRLLAQTVNNMANVTVAAYQNLLVQQQNGQAVANPRQQNAVQHWVHGAYLIYAAGGIYYCPIDEIQQRILAYVQGLHAQTPNLAAILAYFQGQNQQPPNLGAVAGLLNTHLTAHFMQNPLNPGAYLIGAQLGNILQ